MSVPRTLPISYPTKSELLELSVWFLKASQEILTRSQY